MNEIKDFSRMLALKMQRRRFVKSCSLASLGVFLSANSSACNNIQQNKSGKNKLLNFIPVKPSQLDTVLVPQGYRAKVLISWGEPLFAGAPEFDPSGKSDTAAQMLQFGDNNDGMAFFPVDDWRAVLAVNNESINVEYLYAHKGRQITAQDVEKGQAALGVSVFEIVREQETWRVDLDGKLNRRITANTLTEMTGPVVGHDLLKTKADPGGQYILGTINNCANGVTPWASYLTCEENFNKYFGSKANIHVDEDKHRYGIHRKDKTYKWSRHDERFDIAKNPNEPNRFGWVVEIDPFNPSSTPKKRSALGRFKHENAALTVNHDGRIVVYMGDDERGEHLYKFVSAGKYNEAEPSENRDLLENGTLYVAKFYSEIGQAKGNGEWLELTHGKNGLTVENGFADQAEILVFTRRAATQVGATTMDRPELVAIHPDKQSVCCSLTNNKSRGVNKKQKTGGPNPRTNNRYGQILRWRPANSDHGATSFDWDLLVIAGNPGVHHDEYAGSDNINETNMFNSPDGLGFDADGRLWILTDGDYSNEGDFHGMGNNQMLCADPVSGEIRRFMTGPIACEITGITFSDDYKTLFVGIQHPGEKGQPSHFPEGGNSKPRSSIIMINKTDGGVIGS